MTHARAGIRRKGEGKSGRGSDSTGGTSGKDAMALPLKGLARGAGYVKRRDWPHRRVVGQKNGKLVLKGRYFITKTKKGTVVMFRRKGKKSWKKGERTPIVPLWAFIRQNRIKRSKRWQLREQTNAAIGKNWGKFATQAVAQAIATAKK